MNLKTRIRKVEKHEKVSDFCKCQGKPRCETTYLEDGLPATCPQLLANQPPLPDLCETCGKPINKTQIIIDFVSPTIPKPEGA